MGRRLLVALLVLVLPLAAQAQKRAFTIEDVYRVKSIPDVQISPDGRSVLYAVNVMDLGRAKTVSHVWTMDIDGRNARQLTNGEKGENTPGFSPDGKWISYLNAADGALYAIPAAGGEPKKLLSLSTGISDPVWSRDGKWVAFSYDVYPECGGDESCNKRIEETWTKGPLKAHMADELLFRHWTQWKDGKRTHVFLANADTGAARDLTPGDFDSPPFQLGGPRQYDISPDGKEIVFGSNHDKNQASSTNSDLWLISLTDAQAGPRNITGSNPAFDGHPAYSPDGKYIAYRMQQKPGYESDLFRLALYDRASGKSEVVSESFRDWVEDFQWSSDSQAIYFSAPVKGQTPIYRYDLKSKKIAQLLADRTILAFDVVAGRVIYSRSSVGEPVEIYSSELRDGKASQPARLTRINQAVANEVDIRAAEQMWVEGASGARIHVFVVKPHGFDPSKKYPLILNVHGGPQSQWSDAFRADWQVYPGAGYVVAFANPHGSTGYGQDFTAAISGDWSGKPYEDLMKVTDALEKLPYVDRNRLGAMGWSYGGYMMNWFEGHTDRFKAIASMMGLYDLPAFYGATEELWFPEWDLKGQPWNSQLYDKLSPSNYAKNFKTPCLVITGERDYRVPYTQALEFFTALQKMDVPSRLIVYSNAGHWPSWYEMAFYYTAHVEWFHKYLGGAAPPWSTNQFLRNAVFDQTTGKRLVSEPAADASGGSKPATEKRNK